MKNKLKRLSCLILTGSLLNSTMYLSPAFAAGSQNSSSSSESISEKTNYIKLDSKEGYINNAVAFSENRFYINGNMIDENNDTNCYLSNGNYTSLDNDFYYSDISLYDKNYLSAESGDFFINLETGEITDDNIQELNLIKAETSLRKTVRKTADDSYSDYNERKSLTEIPNYKFNDTWYETTYTSEENTNGNAGGFPLTVYTDLNGNYIDADYSIGKFKIVTENKTVSINNTDKSNSNTSISVKHEKTIGHDTSNIYRLVSLTINSDEKILKVNGLSIKDIKDIEKSAFTIENDGQSVSFNAIQKISKEQSSDDIDGAKYSKSVTTYIMSKEDGSKISLADNLNYAVSKGKIITYSLNDNHQISASTISLKTSTAKNTKGYTFIGNKRVSAEDCTAYDVDSNGTLWMVNKSWIYRFATTEWVKAFRTDGTMDNISIYDSNNFIVWNNVDEIYSIYANKPASSSDTDKNTNTNESSDSINNESELIKEDVAETESTDTNYSGWIKNEDDTWSYILEDSSKKTGWLLDNLTWYYLDSNGIMKTGWLNDNGTWYYLDNSGAMLSSTTVDGYVLNTSGAWIN